MGSFRVDEKEQNTACENTQENESLIEFHASYTFPLRKICFQHFKKNFFIEFMWKMLLIEGLLRTNIHGCDLIKLKKNMSRSIQCIVM